MADDDPYAAYSALPTAEERQQQEEQEEESDEEEEEDEDGTAAQQLGRPPLGPGGARASVATPGLSLHAVRSTQLQALTQKRSLNLAYIQRTHAACAGDQDGRPPIHWLNTVALSGERLREFVESEVPKARAILFFRLGLSLGRLLLLFKDNGSSESVAALGETAALVRALLQLFEELECHSANGALQSMRLLMARPAESPYPEPRLHLGGGGGGAVSADAGGAASSAAAVTPPTPPRPGAPPSTTTEPDDNDDDDNGRSKAGSSEPLAAALQPKLLRFGSEATYEAFRPVPAPPFPLSYPAVLDSLAHVLGQMYALLGGPRHAPVIVAHASLFEAVVRVDAQVKHHVINPVAKELTALAAREAKRELDWLREAYLGGGGVGSGRVV